MATKIGLISDTHGRLDSRIVPLFEREGVGAIIHAGDIGGPDILWELNAVAPVTAVLGNGDYAGVPGWSIDPIARVTIPLAREDHEGDDPIDVRIAVVHVLGHLKPVPDDLDVVVAGHTHVPSAVVCNRGGTLCVNPGSPSRPRAGTNPTVGILERDAAGELRFRTVELSD